MHDFKVQVSSTLDTKVLRNNVIIFHSGMKHKLCFGIMAIV